MCKGKLQLAKDSRIMFGPIFSGFTGVNQPDFDLKLDGLIFVGGLSR